MINSLIKQNINCQLANKKVISLKILKNTIWIKNDNHMGISPFTTQKLYDFLVNHNIFASDNSLCFWRNLLEII